jgi:hypothetical protein
MTGRQYVEGDSPAAVVWLSISLVIAPLVSRTAVWALGRRRLVWSRTLAGLAVVPNLLHFGGLYALVPFHPLVLVLTFVTFAALMLPRGDSQSTRSIRAGT